MTLRPSAHGSLAKTPFAHLLLYLQARKLSGTLAVWPEPESDTKGQDRILFDEGQLVAMRPMAAADSLDAALLPLFARSQAQYGFYEGQNLLGQNGVLHGPLDIHTLLSRGLRAHVNEPLMDSVLERLRGRSLRLRAGTPLDRLELGARERALIEPLRTGAASIESLLASDVLPRHDAKRTLYLLTLLRAIEAAEDRSSIPAVRIDSFPPRGAPPSIVPSDTLGDMPGPASGSSGSHPPVQIPRAMAARYSLPSHPSSPPSAPPEGARTPTAPPAPLGLSPVDEARWNEIANLYARRDDLTHYELLNVPRTAASHEVQAAYFALVKRIHPDRLPLPLAPLARATQALFERLTEANETLTNPKLRADYDQAVAGGGGTRAAERTLRHVLEATVEFQKSEVLTRRRDYAEAMQLVRSALAKNPDDPDYHAHHAWLLHLMNPGATAPLDEMLRSLDRALKVNPRHERAHYYKGLVLRRLKREAEAIRHFRAAAEINPHNVDAAREVRLAIMRRGSKPPPSGQGGGVLSRLFKKS